MATTPTHSDSADQSTPEAAVYGECSSFRMAPFERLRPPAELDGRAGSRRIREGCKIEADTDLEAIRLWVDAASHSEPTMRARRVLAERLMNWAYADRGKAVSSLEPGELGEFIDFAASPGPSDRWVQPRGGSRSSPDWRPFTGPASVSTREATAAHLSSLVKFLCKVNYANLHFSHGKRRARDGIADSSLAYQRDRSERHTEPIPFAEMNWVFRALKARGTDGDNLIPRLVVELFYFAELKATVVIGLTKATLQLPDLLGGPWRLMLRGRDGKTVREIRYVPRPLTNTLLKWFSADTARWDAFEMGEPLLKLSRDGLVDTVKAVFEEAAILAEEGEDLESAEGLHGRTAMSLRRAYGIHYPNDPLLASEAFMSTLRVDAPGSGIAA